MSSPPHRPFIADENRYQARMNTELPQTEDDNLSLKTTSLLQSFIDQSFSREDSTTCPPGPSPGQNTTATFRDSKISRKKVPNPNPSGASSFTYVNPPDGDAYTSDVALLSLPSGGHGGGASKETSQKPPKEWVPIMLRKVPAALLTLTCLTIAILLECLNIVARNRQGFSTDNRTSVQLARYLPTVAVICLGFAWKSLVSDLKIVTPYSIMSARWSESPKSMLLDYVDSLEFISVWTSARHGHWAMFLGLVIGLLCGILVPLANALTFVNLYSPVEQHSSIVMDSQFSFKDTLASKNGTLYIPWDYRGSQPYAAVASSRQPNGKNGPWTVDDFAFESLNITQWLKQNVTVGAHVQAFNAPFECMNISYVVANETHIVLNADGDDLAKANCRPPLTQSVTSAGWDPEQLGWLNVTDCSDNGTDIRMLATVASRPFGNGSMVDAKAIGFLCRPKYFIRQANIRLNGSTGDILSFSFEDSHPTPIDIGADLPVVVTYLNNPLDPESQSAYRLSPVGPYKSGRLPQATFENVTRYASEYSGHDVFFDQLLSGGRNISEYIDNPALFESEVVDLSNTILTKVISSFARTNVTRAVNGSVTLHESRLHVRPASLRGMQAILAFMGLICGLCCTILRPKSRLTEDPSSLAAVSVILSASENRVEQKLQEVVMSDPRSTNESLSGWRWLLSSKNATSVIEANEVSEQSPGSNRYETMNAVASVEHEPQPSRYQPLPFHLVSRVVLLFSLSAVITTLAVLLRISTTSGGFLAITSTASAAWSVVPTTILVLVGYGVSSVHGVLQSFTPYLALHRNSGSKSLLYGSYSFVLLMPIYAILRFGSIALATSSIMALLFPGAKILAAGLYVPIEAIDTGPVQVILDTSLMDGFEAMYEMFRSQGYGYLIETENAMVRRASQFSEWTSIPYFGVPHRAGAMGNLVFSNLTNLGDDHEQISDVGSLIATRVPAIAVNLTCTSLGPEHFQAYVLDNTPEPKNETNWKFSMRCASKICNDTFGDQAELVKWTKAQNPEFTTHRYFGRAQIKGYSYLGGSGPFDTPYLVTLGDFSSILEPFTNQTLLSNTTVKLEPGMFNYSSSPSMVAVSCSKAFWEVNVNVQMTKTTRTRVNGTEILPWDVSAYDKDSIEYVRQYNKTTPLWAYPKSSHPSQYNDDRDGVIDNDSLWPTRGESTNMFELIAAHQQFQVGDVSGVLDENQLSSAVQSVFTSYCVEIITELRTHTTAIASKNSTRTVPGTISTPLTRMKQDARTTIALCVVLAAMLAGLVYIFVSFPRESLMAKPPTSIAAQMSLLAGSSLVRQLRDGNVQSAMDTDFLKKKFRLCWWPVGGGGGWRWGIDAIGSESESESLVHRRS
ncbi:uncharacterized protein BP5553_06823 [Venustampulla echinocandica]|uniref:Uncharacterized protein n=1 Tax=Venustampulla echinocandica TaxID=2656787 RepID=A0A370TL06_9HELO|nr:uncharacterized protein BP5553_06823 [Venustampulla echinocandica]RDL36211.1 hypothetical protein BP5553_06823 [Venustampulla echinocandica]